ncbi:hypothetical protein ACLOJK_009574 [Asimina triloba]
MPAARRHYHVPTCNSSASCISVASTICIASVISVASATRLRHQRLLHHFASTRPPQPSRLHSSASAILWFWSVEVDGC